jgi:hypothetical protein
VKVLRKLQLGEHIALLSLTGVTFSPGDTMSECVVYFAVTENSIPYTLYRIRITSNQNPYHNHNPNPHLASAPPEKNGEIKTIISFDENVFYP